MQGLGFFNLYTAGQKGRLIGNILIENRAGTVVGFENHGGRTYLEDPNLEPFGRWLRVSAITAKIKAKEYGIKI
jgi:CobQ-like glutamine amidotransferase family enzyme